MKKISVILLALVMVASLSACGRNNDTGATDRNDMTILPTAIPTMETNIPDPEVDTQMPMYTDDTGVTVPGTVESQDSNANHK